MNAIAVYVASGLVAVMMGVLKVAGGSISLQGWIYRNAFASWAGPTNGSLAFALAYVTLYLGLGLLLLRLLRRFSQVNILVSILIHPMLVLVGVVTPRIVLGLGGMLDEYWDSPLMMITCPFTSPALVMDGPMGPFDAPTVVTLVLVSGAALLVFILNLPAVAEEVRQVRTARPWRVEQEDLALAPPKPRVKTNPWDD